MKIVFMGTPDFAVPTLEKLHEEGYEIQLVVTQPDRPKGRGKKMTAPPIKESAEALGLKVYQPENINSMESIALIKSYSPDYLVVVAYGQIFKEELLNTPQHGCINVHASLLPFYRGSAPINWAIINGEKKTGVTTMLMNRGMDTGDILLIEESRIDEEDTAQNLHDKLMVIGAKLLIETLKGLQSNEIVPTKQKHIEATYAPLMDKGIGKIDWTKRADEIKNLIRGTNPWPGAYFYYKDKKIKVYEVAIQECRPDEKPGKVLKVDQEGIYVAVKDKCVIIKKLQIPGKRQMPVHEYLMGNNFETDIILK